MFTVAMRAKRISLYFCVIYDKREQRYNIEAKFKMK
jgi:hypothetical protein